MNKRIIKNENLKSKNVEISEIPSNTLLMHPISTTLVKPSINPMCLTKYNLNNNKLSLINNYKCQSGVNNYNKYMYVPPIGISSNDLLIIYDIRSIDNLNDWITNNIETSNEFTINRILNCFLKNNYETLKLYNNILENIYYKILNKFHYEYIDKIKEKDIKNFIDYWIDEHNENEFSLNLLEDMINYIIKKYK